MSQFCVQLGDKHSKLLLSKSKHVVNIPAAQYLPKDLKCNEKISSLFVCIFFLEHVVLVEHGVESSVSWSGVISVDMCPWYVEDQETV